MAGLAALALLASLPAIGVTASAAPAAQAAPQAGTGPAVTHESATARAVAAGEPVEVVGERTEYSSTLANPDGTYSYTQSAVPQRVKGDNGQWHAVDATLEKRADGTVGPKSAVVDLAFSGGGDGANLIEIGNEQGSMRLGWPDRLPEPRLDGAKAVYPEVFQGVDLELTATAEGYREVLVVKSAEAAAEPTLERVELTTSSEGLKIVPGAGGGLRAVDENGNTVFKGPAGQMWDSASEVEGPAAMTAARTAAATAPGPEPDPVEEGTQPRAGDASAVMPVHVDDDTVSVKPDLGLLRGSDTVYPVRIDPSVGLSISERTVLSSDGDKFWQFNGDYGVGKCSVSGPYYCGSNYTNRMYFEYSPSKLAGKYILDATFRAYNTWSFSCDPKWVDLERTNNISEGTRWPGPTQLDQMGDRHVSNGRGTNCSPDQPDAWVEFNDNPEESDENLAATVRKFADGSISRLTLMLRAKDEGDPEAWKRFDDNAELKVTYAYKPGVPTRVGVIPGDGTTAYCNKSSSSPLIVTRRDPMVQAAVQTLVEHNAGDEEGSLQAEFIVERGDDAAWHQVWSGYRPDSGWDPDGTLEKLRTSNRADGGLYRLKSRTQSHWSYGGKSGDLFSSYSSWCYFKIDSTAPKAPVVTAGSPYTQCTATLCEGKGGPGVRGSFTFKPNAADTDIAGYRWRLLTTSAKETKTVTGSTVTVPDVTPSLSGTQVLSVEARDVRNRWGAPSEFTFKVSPAAGPVGTWHLDDGAPESGVTLAKDTATEGTRHDAILQTPRAGWSTLARRGDTDYSLYLNDSSSADNPRDGYAATASPAVNTKDSFTISAWAYLTDTSSTKVVLAAPGTKASAFTLYYSASYKKWVFNRTATDTGTSPVYLRSLSESGEPPLRVWTHLTGVFDTKGDTDKTNDTIQLFVNGRPQGKPVVLNTVSTAYTPWVSSGGMQFGRSLVGGAWGEHYRGRLDEVSVWQRALTGDEVAQEAQLLENSVPANELVAHWDAAGSTATELKELSSYPVQALKLSASGATLDDQRGLVLDGTVGHASATGPVTDESGSFTATARVQLDSAKLAAKPVGYEAQVVGQQASAGESSWALSVVKPADGVYQWKFTRTAVGTDGKVTQSAQVPGGDIAETDTWVQVTGVFDAQEAWEWTDPADGTKSETRYGKLHLYVGQFDQPSEDDSGFTAAQQGTGAIAVGRGSKGGSTGRYLPGALEEVRIWTGAMSPDQIASQVIGLTAL
ncbi:LamG domain-containing protein [Streptomyces sp. TRM75563]|uniref:LamG domain-containing protein n=1 Tax=Streptomyces sp. TRM75563 TaxID=2817418 RepID=UPI001F60FBED|nr:LamG domain-containing protein [Streptomyces sp. TRM75563]MCI4043072.1 LamG domain-containing protein [Streptomyces sp. TRM75563]